MKKILFASLLLGGFTLSFAAEAKTEETVKSKESKTAVFYFPVTITSSCGYTETFEFTPGVDDPGCIDVEVRQMEEFCAAPVEGWGLA
ncbi:hypothetical protein [Chryseobacterium mulctrae]|uniref:hypothetical protein n=1 Tax=Chryseobacterium mulctrae TaxID=2576777 RepID=UPI001117A45E|nr:hypothetical protein [Chryseobacterium mulctrae]